jgi:release factor glutamine methyltransferase
MKTVEQAICAASKCLEGVGVENPRLESEFLIAAFLKMPRTHLVLNRHQALPDQKIRALRGWVRERQMRKPLAYVTGEQPFRDLTLKITPSVLVPRPETELLVEQALRILDQSETFVTAVDVGTGSGNIALCLSLHPKVQRVIGIDQSAAALNVARSNEKRVQRGAPVQWMQGDLLAPLRKRDIRAALVVANLPYVRTREIEGLEPELHWEPRLALDGGRDGLRLIEPCILEAADILEPGGVLLLEIGADQSRDIAALLERTRVWINTQIFRDLAGLPRIVQTQKKGT